MTPEGGTPDPRQELAELAAAVRAYVEWQADTGAAGLPITMGDPRRVPQAPPVQLPRWGSPDPRRRSCLRSRYRRGRLLPYRPPPPPRRRSAAGYDGRPEGPHPPGPGPDRCDAGPRRPPTRAVEVGADERRTRLALIAEEVRSCTKCVLHEKRRQTVFSRGDPFAELVFIGEGPGADEDAQGAPFVGAAGQLLDRMIAAMGYQRDDVYVANIVKCRPPNNRKPEPAEMATCMPYLVQQLGLVKPKVIVALGATAVQGLCGSSEGITRLRGKWKLYKGSIPVMPTFHPAYLLRQPAAKREVWLDLQEVMKHLGKSLPTGRG